MSTPSSTCSCSRWLIAVFLGSLGSLLATSGCSGSDKERGKEPTADTLSLQEKKKDTEKEKDPVAKPLPSVSRDPPLVARPEAVFMGTRAVGKRFCIIADASNSMQGAPLAQLKKEIVKTLDDLAPESQFYIMFFNATDIPMPHSGWLDASKDNVAKVKPWVKGMTTKLKTLPQSAFTRAFLLDPKPDVIFFMTDGFLHGKKPDPVTHVNRLNSGNPKVVIHTIMFSKHKAGAARVKAAADQLRGMAEKNGGTFRHVTQK